jgi:hypothetical protein
LSHTTSERLHRLNATSIDVEDELSCLVEVLSKSNRISTLGELTLLSLSLVERRELLLVATSAKTFKRLLMRIIFKLKEL